MLHSVYWRMVTCVHHAPKNLTKSMNSGLQPCLVLFKAFVVRIWLPQNLKLWRPFTETQRAKLKGWMFKQPKHLAPLKVSHCDFMKGSGEQVTCRHGCQGGFSEDVDFHRVVHTRH